MQKIIQKFENRDVRGETMGNDPYIYNNLSTNQGKSKETATHHVIHIHTGSSGKLEVTFEPSQILRKLLIALHMT